MSCIFFLVVVLAYTHGIRIRTDVIDVTIAKIPAFLMATMILSSTPFILESNATCYKRHVKVYQMLHLIYKIRKKPFQNITNWYILQKILKI
jgi:hypothetical protein